MRSQNVGQFYDFLKSVKDDHSLLVKYGNNPAGLFKDGGLDVDNLPPEILGKISAAGMSLDDVLSGVEKGVDTAAKVAGIISIFL